MTYIASIVLIIYLMILSISAYVVYLVIKALRKYINTKDIREDKKDTIKSLVTALRENRMRCKMTQEFVAESLGISRQAVSKWENGTSDPSTSNLLALAELYGVSAADLLKSVGE